MEKIKTLSLDLETYSDVYLNKCGVYKYAESPAFEVLLFGVSVNGGEVQVYDLASGEEAPTEIIAVLSDDSVTKWAFNAAFERVCLSAWLQRNYPKYFYSYSINEDTVGDYLDPSAWKCSMIWAAYMGLPLSLADVGAAIGLEKQKLMEGKELIRYFCVPCKQVSLYCKLLVVIIMLVLAHLRKKLSYKLHINCGIVNHIVSAQWTLGKRFCKPVLRVDTLCKVNRKVYRITLIPFPAHGLFMGAKVPPQICQAKFLQPKYLVFARRYIWSVIN